MSDLTLLPNPTPTRSAVHGQSPSLLAYSEERREVSTANPNLVEQLLNEAESSLIEVALNRRPAGILVTRHHSGRYVLELSEEVPFGESRERSAW
ncbi:hypothetical protein SRABI26_02494 [Arthrobacter sp. Bi26]|nr:hypothetical protein SRABI26_02494 [Arthrobacter sp. Bi26]